LSDKDGKKLSPHQIEQHLLAEKVLADRVLELFTNYRQQWRNPSTHDHTLFFNEQEALLAIVNVSAFASILLDQMIGVISYKQEQEDIKNKKDKIEERLGTYGNESFVDQVLVLLDLFSEELKSSEIDLNSMREVEIIGKLNGFIDSLDSTIQVFREPSLAGEKTLRPDFILLKQDEKVVIELKRPGYSERNLEYSREQIRAYLIAGKFEHGIIYLPPAKPEDKMEVTKTEAQFGDQLSFIHVVAPRHNR
jgi:hypothetical protein